MDIETLANLVDLGFVDYDDLPAKDQSAIDAYNEMYVEAMEPRIQLDD